MTGTTNMQFTWNRIYSAAEEIRKMNPWEWMAETDIFGIKIPGTDQIYFISVMGSAGQVTAISAYMGTRALGMYWELQQYDPVYLSSSFTAASRIFTIPQLMLDFVEEEQLESEQIKRIKNFGGKPSKDKLWPVLDQFVPGFVPGEPDEQALGDAPVILEQCLEIFEHTKEDEDFIYSGDDNENLYLIREIKEGSKTEWQNVFKEIWVDPVEYNIRFPSISLSRLQNQRIKQDTLQIDLIMLPTPVKEGDIKPYYPFMLLVVNKKTGIIQNYIMLSPLPDLDTMYESIPEKILDMFLESNYVPFQVEIRSEILITLLSKLLDRAGITLKKPGQMKAMDEAIEGMMEHMNKR